MIIILIPLSNFYLAQLCWALHIKLLFFYLFQICFNVFSWQFLSRILWFNIEKNCEQCLSLNAGAFSNMSGKKKMKAVIVQSKLVDLRKFISRWGIFQWCVCQHLRHFYEVQVISKSCALWPRVWNSKWIFSLPLC